MTNDLEALARRAVTCKHWKWMPGMRVMVPPKYDGATGFSIRLGEYGYVPAPHEYPDLSDPATMGCLLALVREAWGRPHAFVEYQTALEPPFYCNVKKRGFVGATEAAVLVAALEAAP